MNDNLQKDNTAPIEVDVVEVEAPSASEALKQVQEQTFTVKDILEKFKGKHHVLWEDGTKTWEPEEPNELDIQHQEEQQN